MPLEYEEIRDVLVKLKEQGKTVFLNSHLLSELEMVCDRVAILVQGQVASQGTISELTFESQRYEIDVRGRIPHNVLDDLNGASSRQLDDGASRIIILGSQPEPIQQVIDKLRRQDVTILAVRPMRETLEELFMRAVTDPETGKARLIGAGGD